MSIGERIQQGLAAGLMGLRDYVVTEQATAREERRLDGIALREQAMAKFNQGISNENAARDAAIQKDRDVLVSGLRTKESDAELSKRSEIASAAAAAEKEAQIAKENRENKEWRARAIITQKNKLDELKAGSQNRMTEAEYDARLGAIKTAVAAGQEIDTWGRKDDGTVFGITKTGRVIETTANGTLGTGSSSENGGSALDRARAGGGGKQDPGRAEPAKPAPAKAAPPAAKASPKSGTEAQVRSIMNSTGWSREDTLKYLKENEGIEVIR